MEIIPNWHPLFVHFTIGIFGVSVIFYITAYALSIVKPSLLYVSQLKLSALWCLRMAGIFTLFTLGAGLYAYMTVQHIEEAHPFMLIHRNWALPTGIGIIVMSIFATWFEKGNSRYRIFLLLLIILQILVMYVGWLGAELVFRHGVGVIPVTQPLAPNQTKDSMPKMPHHEH